MDEQTQTLLRTLWNHLNQMASDSRHDAFVRRGERQYATARYCTGVSDGFQLAANRVQDILYPDGFNNPSH